MNDRIKELSKQAFEHAYANGIRISTHIPNSYTEKFAELIVQECIGVMVKNDYHGAWLGEKIKDHFGFSSGKGED